MDGELNQAMDELRADLAALQTNPIVPAIVKGAVFKAVRLLQILIDRENQRCQTPQSGT